MNAIRQRKGFETRSYSLDPETGFIDVELKTLKKKSRYRIHLSEVGNKISYHSKKEVGERIFYGISALISIYCIGYYFLGNPENPGSLAFNAIGWGILALSGFSKPSKDDLHITNGEKLITLFRNKPTEEQALEFANSLIKMANEMKKEMLINFELTEEQFLANIHWLQSMKLIDKMELRNFKRNSA